MTPLLLVLVLVGTVASVDDVTTDVPDHSPVSYEGAQLLWVCPQTVTTEDKAPPRPPVLDKLVNSSALEFWSRNETCWQYLASGEKTAAAKKEMEDAGLTVSVAIADLQRAIDEENPSPSPDSELLADRNVETLSPVEDSELRTSQRYSLRQMKKTSRRPKVGTKTNRPISKAAGHRLTWTMYHRLADIYSYIDYLSETYPSVSVGSLGTSVEGRPIKYVKVSSGSPNAKSIWIDGGIHAREWISPATVTYILHEIVENRDSYEQQLSGIDFYVVPVLNPDGYEYTHTRDRLWRKNRSKGGYYCQGTDLNRNWGFRWGGKGASKQQCQEIYGGRGPFSEPETRAVSSFIQSSVPNAKGFVTFHSYGQYILYPFGYDDGQLPSDHADLDRVGRKMASAIRQSGGSQYTVGNSANLLYPASGGADDWAKGTAQIKYSYTIELRDRGRYGFVLPAQFILPTGKEAFAAIRVLAAEVQALS